jgi:PD-(D/E)XK nuclease superfamily
VIKNFSSSQVELFLDCKRKHFNKSILKIPDPPNESAQRGIGIHKALEIVGDRLAEGMSLADATNLDSPEHTQWAAFVAAAAQAGALPGTGEPTAREHRFQLPTSQNIPFLGVIDLVRDELHPIDITDWKTISDIRYAKTPGELITNLQLNVYAHYIFENTDVDQVRTRLVYLEAKKKPLKTKLPRTMNVHVDLERESVRAIWQGERPFFKDGQPHYLPTILDRMIETSTCQDPDEIEPNTETCTKYGGCPYRANCGLSPFAGVGSATDHAPLKRILIEESKTMGFLSKNNGTNGTVKAAPTPTSVPETKTETPAPAAKSTGFLARARAAGVQVPTGVVPPDAPSRVNEPVQAALEPQAAVQAAPEAEAPKKRGRPRKIAPEAAQSVQESTHQTEDDSPAPVRAEAPAPVAAPAPKTGKSVGGMILYVDCYPIRGASEVMTFGDDWYSSIEMEMDQKAKEDGLDSYWLWSFARQKAELALAVKNKIDKGLPPVMLIKSSSNMAREVLPMLIPWTAQVIQAIR